jgi:membrane protein DedA with SNARE-associated domain
LVDGFLEWLRSVPWPVLYLILMVLSALENVFPPVPADVAVALGAFLSKDLRSASTLGAACWVANMASSAAMYFFARTHKDFFRRGWPRKLLTPEAMAALERAYARYGLVGIFVSRFLPTVRAAVTPFAGVVGVSPMRALVPAGLASALWYAVLVFVGALVSREWDRVQRIVAQMSGVLGLIGLAATAVAGIWIWRQSRRRHAD